MSTMNYLLILYLIIFLDQFRRFQSENCADLLNKELEDLQILLVYENLIQIKFNNRIIKFEIPVLSKDKHGSLNLWFKQPIELNDLNTSNLKLPDKLVIRNKLTYIFNEDGIEKCKLELIYFKEDKPNETNLIDCDELTFYIRLIPIGYLNIYVYDDKSKFLFDNLLLKYNDNLFEIFNLTNFVYSHLLLKKMDYKVKNVLFISETNSLNLEPTRTKLHFNLIELDYKLNFYFIYLEQYRNQMNIQFKFIEQHRSQLNELLPCYKFEKTYFEPNDIKGIIVSGKNCFIFLKFHYFFIPLTDFVKPFWIQKKHLAKVRKISEKEFEILPWFDLIKRNWFFEIKNSLTKLFATYNKVYQIDSRTDQIKFNYLDKVQNYLYFDNQCPHQPLGIYILDASEIRFYCFLSNTYYYLGKTLLDGTNLKTQSNLIKYEIKSLFPDTPDNVVKNFLNSNPKLISIHVHSQFAVFVFFNALIYVKNLYPKFEANELSVFGNLADPKNVYFTNHCLFTNCV